MYRSLSFLALAVLAMLVVGCAAPAAGSFGDPTAMPSGVESPVATPETVASPVASPEVYGELEPDVLNEAVEWLATEANVSAADVRLVEAQRVEWTDSCFGLGGPAESCLAAITPGYRIIFEAGGQEYEVRTDESGTGFRLAPQAS